MPPREIFLLQAFIKIIMNEFIDATIFQRKCISYSVYIASSNPYETIQETSNLTVQGSRKNFQIQEKMRTFPFS